MSSGDKFHKNVRKQIEESKQWTESVVRDMEHQQSTSQTANMQNSVLAKKPSQVEQSEIVRSDSRDKGHWDHLYELAKVKQETRELIKKEKAKLVEKELDQCTFTPKILTTSSKLAEKIGEDLFKRSEQWENAKKNKMKNIKETYEEKELLHCTFQPTHFSNKEYFKSRENKIEPKVGIEKFLERQQQARAEKERVKNILEGKNMRSKQEKEAIKNSYRKRHLKSEAQDFDEHFVSLKGSTFGDAAVILHVLLHRMEVKY